MTPLLHGELSRDAIGCFYEVYNQLGHGFLEKAYRKAMAIALTARGLEVRQEVPFELRFRHTPIGHYRADLVVADRLIVECKAVERLVPAHRSQLINYLRATELPLGLLFNFGPHPEFERFVLSPRSERSAPSAPDPRHPR
jgi:GxxExxY protein